MNKLIIITGITGIGKTTISKQLRNHYDATLISIDDIKEAIYDIVGFKSLEDKYSIREIIKSFSLSLLGECMKRDDKVIIIEHTFREEWNKKFQELLDKYPYECFSINIRVKNPDFAYQQLVNRNNSDNRHISHSLESYNPYNKNEYKSINHEPYKKWIDNYSSLEHTISIGKSITFYNYEDDINLLINFIDNKV